VGDPAEVARDVFGTLLGVQVMGQRQFMIRTIFALFVRVVSD
jgi:hypothetical protein